MSLLEIKDLSIEFETRRGRVRPVEQLSLTLDAGETLGLVGESGCGKSLTSLSIMGLLPSNAKAKAEKLKFDGKNLDQLSKKDRRMLRGKNMAMIFQDPMTSLNPSFTIGFQIMETLKIHKGGHLKDHREQSINLLKSVGISDPERNLGRYPYELSGGMCQRVMIAMSVACCEGLLIADEPTTALDVTIQAQILQLLTHLQKEKNIALLLITHDIGVVAEMTDRIGVMYAGRIVEMGQTAEVIKNPKHPYTKALLESLPSMHKGKEHLPSISGLVPDLLKRPSGCQFHPRCEYVKENCKGVEPDLVGSSKKVRCYYPLEDKL